MSNAPVRLLLFAAWLFAAAPGVVALAQTSSLPEAVRDAIQTKNYESGLERLNAELEATPDDMSLAQQYSAFLASISREGTPEALAFLRRVVEDGLKKPSRGIAESIAISSAVQTLLLRDDSLSLDEKLGLLDRLDSFLEGEDDRLEPARRMALTRRIALLTSGNRLTEASQLLEAQIESAREGLDPADDMSVQSFVAAVISFSNLGGPAMAVRAEELTDEALALTATAVAREEVTLPTVAAYCSIRLTRATALARTDPEAAEAVLEELEQAIAWAPERLDERSARSIGTYARSVQSLRARIEAAKRINAMVGKDAPEIDAEHFVASDPVTMESLRGRVVLIDFWAIWCGPCIATFPHLIEWHEKYADRGLVILGATRFYGYEWDEEAGRATRGENVPAEAELEMLEKFRESHGLRHGFFVTPSDSRYQSDFGVTGIPHAVVIDREGKIQLVRIGSGEANARDLEAKIEELLGG